jgi:hypothetical protein
MRRQGNLGSVVTRSGLTLDDRYRLDARIAAGGVGQVWRATDLLLERPVAVKVLRPEYSDHPETLDRFRKEARHAGSISNAHVAQVYDYGAAGPGGSPYLVMEYVDGPSLADLLAVDPLDPVRALDVVAQAAEGLSAAHRAGLVHRDVKPGNILISREGQVKVTDFGIAHAAGQLPVTGPGLVMGTTQYMAPERIAGNQGTAASDVYALGIVLHECLTGMPPHDGTPAEVMAAHLYLPLPPLPAGTAPELEDLVARLTVKDPAQRIADARELADVAAMLRDSLRGGPRGPATRAAARTAGGPVAAGSVPRAAAPAVEPVPALAGPSAARAAVYGAGADPGFAGTTVFRSDEWKVPDRMSLPARPAEPGLPRPPRRRKTGAIAIGAAVASGAFNRAPTANQGPAGSSTPGSSSPGHPASPSASRPASAARPAPTGAGVTAPATPVNVATTATGKPSAGSSGHPGGSASAAPASGGSAPSAPASTPASSASASPGAPPASSPSGGSSPSPSPTSTCLLILCS